MAVTNPSGGGGGGTLSGTAAARPAAGAAANKLYWATDTDEITFSDGSSWHVIGAISRSSAIQVPNGFGIQAAGVAYIAIGGYGLQLANPGGIPNAAFQNDLAGAEATTATAGTAGALPSQAMGYFIARNSSHTTVKIPYFAN